ncbi:unnamed protein product [Medioppia subpectinata]|uniref:Uncharacterized protein n=1 Tax=Medioppia subpectinata TaxID=1979941 RepID=A0A7R9KCH9_9ACAR|nr:unnamed protein product [Medioppia subpectinata]CAG2100681.1 unnamed protein product [Medioppia subpectinata]
MFGNTYMKDSMMVGLFFVFISSSICLAETPKPLDAINLLAECGSLCWAQDKNNTNPDNINVDPELFDESVCKCMQVCFASKAKKVDHEVKLSPGQVQKIKVSAYCGHICYPKDKQCFSKKSLDYCYAGCLGTILQPRLKAQQQLAQNNNQTHGPNQPQG